VVACPGSGSLRAMDEANGGNGPAPLEGVRVLDLSRILAGPLATMVLADLGADVIKVERPVTGDDTRRWGPPFVGGDAAYFLSLNRNKRSIAIDLQTPEGADVVRRLAARSDVLIENFRHGLMSRLGLDLAALRAANPRLVTCSLTAFADVGGGSASLPGYDIIVQALSGLMSITGERGGAPTKVGVALLDVIAGLYAAIGIQAALVERDLTGRGRHVEVALFDAGVAALVNQAANHLLGGVVPEPMGSEHPNIVPYQVFQASDRPFILAAGNDKLFGATCEVIGHPELAADARFATNDARVSNRRELLPLLVVAFAAAPASTWLAALEAAGVPCAPIRRMDEVFASPEGAAMVTTVEDPARGPLRLVADPIRVDGERSAVRRPPPGVGEHTEEILRELDG
jgi:crotonobetainyl-CoA:carnitine CoA-transferase CaiB-like acyl-CoA transferase